MTMNIKGLDYNTQRERLILPEYGREIQNMVDYCKTLPTKQERQRCAESIVEIMSRMRPTTTGSPDNGRKLWDHLAVMAEFDLDIDWPYDVSEAKKMSEKPQPIAYPTEQIPVMHYGKMVFELFEKLKTMPAGQQRDELARLTANQMKRDLVVWSHGSSDDEKVASDLAKFTDGKIQLDLSTFRFDKINVKDLRPQPQQKKKKRR